MRALHRVDAAYLCWVLIDAAGICAPAGLHCAVLLSKHVFEEPFSSVIATAAERRKFQESLIPRPILVPESVGCPGQHLR